MVAPMTNTKPNFGPAYDGPAEEARIEPLTQRVEELTRSFIERGVHPITARYWATIEAKQEANQ